jgi:hypothetical protein
MIISLMAFMSFGSLMTMSHDVPTCWNICFGITRIVPRATHDVFYTG